MPRFLTGDELGNLKSVSYDTANSQTLLKTLRDGTPTGRTRGIHKLAVHGSLLASAHANGALCLASLADQDTLEARHEWKETRFGADASFVGLAMAPETVYACASNGALRRTHIPDDGAPTHALGALPSRLTAWRLSPTHDTFAYGGDDIELSLWDTTRAFDCAPLDTKKRKRADLFPGETWRAKNVANDHLGLRQPVHNTCLTYAAPHQILAGTRLGHLRRYDSRAGRRPVSDVSVAQVGGVRTVEMGSSEHQAFVSDQGTHLCALDLRTGGITYGYKGISGAVNSLALSPTFLASVALDRFARIHSVYPPAAEVGKQQEERGTVLDKVYMTTVPTAIVWDQTTARNQDTVAGDDDEGSIWEQMERVGDKNRESAP